MCTHPKCLGLMFRSNFRGFRHPALSMACSVLKELTLLRYKVGRGVARRCISACKVEVPSVCSLHRGKHLSTCSPTARQAYVGRGCARAAAAAAAAATRSLAQAPRGACRRQRPRARAVLRAPLALAGH